MEITELNPKIVWKYFHEITQVPRPSKKEEKIIAYLEKFAKDHGIEYKKDKVGNIVMCKPATPGYEDRVKLILQSHVDMVCEKNAGTVHDFDNDPIRTIIDGEWLHADGTTLGADNGIGCAAQLAVLASDDIEHGPIEALFTIDEETGMTGAFALQPGFLTGKILINLDSEDEGELFIGCAGGKGIVATFKPEYKAAPQDLVWLRASVSGLKGGHSGGEIHVGLGNANKLLTRYLYALEKNLDWCLAEIGGGNLHNAIPAKLTRSSVSSPLTRLRLRNSSASSMLLYAMSSRPLTPRSASISKTLLLLHRSSTARRSPPSYVRSTLALTAYSV